MPLFSSAKQKAAPERVVEALLERLKPLHVELELGELHRSSRGLARSAARETLRAVCMQPGEEPRDE